MSRCVPADDEVGRALKALTARIARTFGDAVAIATDRPASGIVVTTMEPARPGACRIGWIETTDELIVDAGQHGGRWERFRDTDAVEFIDRLIEAVAAGRVTERFRGRSARLSASLRDGKTARSSVSGSSVPNRPFWRREGRDVQYLPWVPGADE